MDTLHLVLKFLELDVEYPKELHKNHNELPFLAERRKIEKVEILVPNLTVKKNIRSVYKKSESRIEAMD